jgi:hypothetical protein
MGIAAEVFESFTRACLRRIVLSDYYKTLLWSSYLSRPRGRMLDRPYYRAIELATRALASGYGGFTFPPSQGYSLLEFGVANGDSLQVLLHFRDVWRRRFPGTPRMTAVGFDTFEGLPAPRPEDRGVDYRQGDYAGRLEEVQAHLTNRYADVRLVKGLFQNSLASEREFLIANPPIFISIDCDYYSSTMDVFRALLPAIAPHGRLFYFDDVSLNFGTDLTGELRAIREVNAGCFGSDVQLVEYPLHIETGELRHYRQMYRLFRMATAEAQAVAQRDRPVAHALRRSQVSPL